MPFDSLTVQYRIFLVYGKTFSGKKSQLRKRKSIRAEVQKTERTAPYYALVNDYGIDTIVSTICRLLKQGVFESDSNAQNLFSGLRRTHQVDDALPISSRDDVMPNVLVTLDHGKSERPISSDQYLGANSGSIPYHGK